MTDCEIVKAVSEVASELEKSGHGDLAEELTRATIKANVDLRKLEDTLAQAVFASKHAHGEERFDSAESFMDAVHDLVDHLEPGIVAAAEKHDYIEVEEVKPPPKRKRK